MPVEGHVTLPSMEAGRACDDGAAAIIFEERGRQLGRRRQPFGGRRRGRAELSSLLKTRFDTQST